MSLDVTATDMYCGAGGLTDALLSGGASVRLAINHNRHAIAVHNTNFPHVDHACEDIAVLDPRRFPRTTILGAGADCTHHANARGKRRDLQQPPLFDASEDERRAREFAQRSRATMWHVLWWAEVHGYEAIIVENVGEVVTWIHFEAWCRKAENLGYRLQICWFNSMFFGGIQDGQDDGPRPPQSRDRIYIVLTKQGNPAPDLEFRPRAWCPRCARDVEGWQRLKDPHRLRPMRYRRQYDYRCPTCGAEAFPYVAPAATAIDWSRPTQRVGGRRDPLKPATLARIAAGLRRFGYAPSLVPVERGTRRGQIEIKLPRPAAEPLRTQTGRAETGLALPPGFIAELRRHGTARSLADPLATFAASGQHHMLVQAPSTDPGGALVVPVNGHVHDPAGNGRRVRTAAMPIPTQTGDKRFAVVQLPSMLIPAGGTWATGAAVVDRPAPTLMGRQTHGLCQLPAFVDDYNGAARRVTDVLPTQTTIEGNGLVVVPYLPPPPAPAADALVDEAALIALVQACWFRMLHWSEARTAMAFRPDYILFGSNRKVFRLLGQAVTPPVPRWIFRRVADSLARPR